MTSSAPRGPASFLACDTCGRLPDPPRLRETLAKLAAVFPIELLVHAVVLRLDLSHLLTVGLLAFTATVIVVWVVEPSAMRLARRWLHAPTLREHRLLHAAPALWRIRTVVTDRPGSLGRLTRELTALEVNILNLDVHHVGGTVLDELVLSAPHHVGPGELRAAVERGGGTHIGVWPTSAMALADGLTRALDQAIRVAADPDELLPALAELLRAQPSSGTGAVIDGGGTWLKVPWPWDGPLVLTRPGEPFTPGERARAHRLAELAELTALTRLYGRSPAR